MKVRFRSPGVLPTLAAIMGIVVTLAAARWQFDRAEFKTGLKRDYESRQRSSVVDLNSNPVAAAEMVRYRKVSAAGHFMPKDTIFLDNRIRNGIAGYEVITPLALTPGVGVVLVNRGWLPWQAQRNELPKIDTPSGIVTVKGTAVIPTSKILELSDATVEGSIWQNLVLSRYREAFGLNVMNFVIEQESTAADGLLRDWVAPGFGVRVHQSYAVQWLLFASLIVIFYVYFAFFKR